MAITSTPFRRYCVPIDQKTPEGELTKQKRRGNVGFSSGYIYKRDKHPIWAR